MLKNHFKIWGFACAHSDPNVAPPPNNICLWKNRVQFPSVYEAPIYPFIFFGCVEKIKSKAEIKWLIKNQCNKKTRSQLFLFPLLHNSPFFHFLSLTPVPPTPPFRPYRGGTLLLLIHINSPNSQVSPLRSSPSPSLQRKIVRPPFLDGASSLNSHRRGQHHSPKHYLS